MHSSAHAQNVTHVVIMPETRLPEDTKSPLLFLKKEEKPEKPPLVRILNITIIIIYY